MSYGTLYRLTFENLLGDSCQLDIEEEDYAGSVNDLTCEHSPIKIDYDVPSDNIFAPVNGSRATLRLVETTNSQFNTLFSGNVRKYRVSLYITESSDSSGEQELQWRGFIDPALYKVGYNQAPNIVTVVASDQLGYLKQVDWDQEGIGTELAVLGTILNKTDLDFNLYEGINIYEYNHNKTAADTPLDQTYFNYTMFNGYTYYDALHHILFKYRARIRQDRGIWTMYRPQEMYAAFNRRYYTFSAGTFSYSSNDSYNPSVALTSARTANDGLVRVVNASPMQKTSEAWKNYKITHNLGYIENHILNGDFSEWDNGDPANWDGRGNYTKHSVGLSMGSYADDDATVVWQELDFSVRNPGGIKITLNWSNVRVAPEDDMTVRFRLILRDYSGMWWSYVNNVAEYWEGGTAMNVVEVYYENTSAGAYMNESGGMTIETVLPFKGVVTIQLLNPTTTGDGDSSMIWNSVELACIDNTGGTSPTTYEFENYEEEFEHEVEIDSDNIKDGGDFEMMLGDVVKPNEIYLSAPPISTNQYAFKTILWLDSGYAIPTKRWRDTNSQYEDDYENYKTLIVLLKEAFAWYYSLPTRILHIPIISKLLHSTSVIEDTNDKTFVISKATWDVRYCKWTVQAYQIGQFYTRLIDENEEVLVDELGNELYSIDIN